MKMDHVFMILKQIEIKKKKKKERNSRRSCWKHSIYIGACISYVFLAEAYHAKVI